MESYLTYLTVFIGILAVASAAQAVILFFIYRRVTKLADEVEKIAGAHDPIKVKSLWSRSSSLMDEINKQAQRITARLEMKSPPACSKKSTGFSTESSVSAR